MAIYINTSIEEIKSSYEFNTPLVGDIKNKFLTGFTLLTAISESGEKLNIIRGNRSIINTINMQHWDETKEFLIEYDIRLLAACGFYFNEYGDWSFDV